MNYKHAVQYNIGFATFIDGMAHRHSSYVHAYGLMSVKSTAILDVTTIIVTF